jgi:cell division protein WhiA
MLVASELKGELSRIHPARDCCRRAELAGLLFTAPGTDAISTLDHATARIATSLAGSLGMSAVATRAPGRRTPGRHHLEVAVDRALAAGWTWDGAAGHDRRAFVRGVLLRSSVSSGSGGPHLEVVLRDARTARELQRRLHDVGVRTSVTLRRGRQVVYVKGGDELATLLRLAGANRSLLDFESSRVGREVRNRLNRLLNAEEANLGRTVRAADRQLRAIAELESTGRLDQLPQSLRETARERRLQPEADLDTLASALGISRSAVNHRLRRLVSLAEGEDGPEKRS